MERRYRLVETLHRWEVEVELKLAGGRRLIRTIDFEDREHPGFGPAGLVADPLHEPTQADIRDAVRGLLVDALEVEVRQWLIARAEARARSCPLPARWGDDNWLGCWAEHSFWRGDGQGGAALVQRAGVGCR